MAIVLTHPCMHQTLITSRGPHVAVVNVETSRTVSLSNEGSEVICFGFSRSKCELVVCFADKSFKLWINIGTEASVLAHTGVSARRATAAVIDKAGNVLISDKSGDVYRYQRLAGGSLDNDGTVILGHVSMLMVMELTIDASKLLTGDRDNKIRLSNYPLTFDIHGFCLGHHECITAVTLSPCGQFILSGSGDGRMGLWDVATCEILSMKDSVWGKSGSKSAKSIITHIVPCYVPSTTDGTEITKSSVWYAIVCEGSADVQLISIAGVDSKQYNLAVAMTIQGDSAVCSVAFTSCNNVLWLGHLDGRLTAYNVDSAKQHAVRSDATDALAKSLATGVPFLLTESEHKPQTFADFLKAVHDGGTVNYFERKAKRVREAKENPTPQQGTS